LLLILAAHEQHATRFLAGEEDDNGASFLAGSKAKAGGDAASKG
jgi:hypothetical protein